MTDKAKPEPTTLVRRDGTTTQSYGAARGYSWEQFKEGNTVSVRHGAFSERMISAESEQVHAALIAACPWIVDTDAVAVSNFCRIHARYDLLASHVERVAAEEGIENVRPYLLTELTRCEQNLMKATESLGLDPSGRAKLAKDLGLARHFAGAGLGKLVNEGAAIREART